MANLTVSGSIQPYSFNGVFEDSYTYSVSVVGNYAYVWGTAIQGNLLPEDLSLQVVDLSDPSNPSIISTYTQPYIQGNIEAVISGNYAYVETYQNGLQIIDVSNPISPTLVGSYTGSPLYSQAPSLAISGQYLFVSDNADNAVRILDVSNPSNPTLAGSYFPTGNPYVNASAGYPFCVAVSGNYLYVGDFSSEIKIVDVSDPTHPIQVGAYSGYPIALNQTPGPGVVDTPSCMVVSGNYLYVADEGTGFYILDISTPAAPKLVGSYDPDGYFKDQYQSVTISGNFAYLTDSHNNVLVQLDIHDPTHPTLVGSISIPPTETSATLQLAVANGYVLVPDGANGLLLVQPVATNHAPTIDIPDSALTQTISKADALGNDSADGKIVFQDADLSDRPTATIISKNVVAKDAYGNITALSPSLVSVLEDNFTVAPKAGNTNNGEIDWTFSLPNDALGSLPAGYSITLTSTVQIDDHNGGTVPVTLTSNLVSDPLIPYADIIPGHPAPADVVAAALQYQHSLWDSDNCTGLVWAVTEAIGQPFGEPTSPNFTFDSQHVPDPPKGFVLPLPPNAPDKFGEWLTVETSDWQAIVQPGDLVRIPGGPGGANLPADIEGHSFIVVGEDAQGNWLVIDNTDPNHHQGDTGPVIITKHTFDDPNNQFQQEVLHASVAYVSRLEAGPTSSFTGATVTATPGQPLVSGNAQVFLDGSQLQGESITAGNGNDVVSAGSHDVISLGNGIDLVEAGDNNKFTLGNGNDQVNSGSGSVLSIGNGNDVVITGSNSIIRVGNGNDTVSVGETSTVKVGNGNDVIAAGSGSSIILGNGSDTVKTVSSQIYAGSGNDTFVLSANFGQETVTTFNLQKDIIELDRSNFTSLETLFSDMSQHGADTVIADSHGHTITLAGISIAQLQSHQSDFHLV